MAWGPESATEVRDRLLAWADDVAGGESPLYATLARSIAADEHMLRVVGSVPRRQPFAAVFFAAVQYLLFGEPDDELAAWYPSISGEPVAEADPYPAFKRFVAGHRDELAEILPRRRIQTDHAPLSALHVPGYELIHRRTGQPLACIEVGASAGLNLLWDRFGYHYDVAGPGEGLIQIGDLTAPVQLACEVRGDRVPPLPTRLPPVASRLAVDLDPIDFMDDDATRWVKAAVWPDQPERRLSLDAAIAMLRETPVDLVAGDATERLPDAVAGAPLGAAVCVIHTHTAHQLEPDPGAGLAEALRLSSAQRPVFRLSAESPTPAGPLLELRTYIGGYERCERLATVHRHGAWIRWESTTAL